MPDFESSDTPTPETPSPVFPPVVPPGCRLGELQAALALRSGTAHPAFSGYLAPPRALRPPHPEHGPAG